MGFDRNFGMAFAKSQIAASNSLPKKGLAFISLKNSHKEEGVQLAKQLVKLNFKLCGTGGTADYITQHGIKCKKINKNISVENMRGNIDTRIKKLEEGKLDGIILAAAGVKSLNLANKIGLSF